MPKTLYETCDIDKSEQLRILKNTFRYLIEDRTVNTLNNVFARSGTGLKVISNKYYDENGELVTFVIHLIDPSRKEADQNGDI